MGLFNDFLENAKVVVEKVGEKTNEVYDITKLNVAKKRIVSEINAKLKVLGTNYYKASKANALESTDFSKEFSDIDELYTQLEVLSAQVDKVKNIKRCPVCNEACEQGKQYCSNCGNKL